MKNKKDIILGITIILIIVFMTIGFAFEDKILTLNNNLSLTKPGTIYIKEINVSSSNLPTDAGSLVLKNGKIELDYTFSVSKEEKNYSATYLITIQNDSPYDYTFSGFNLEPEFKLNGATSQEAGAVLTYEYTDLNLSDQVMINEVIPATEKRTVVITIHFKIKSENDNTTIDVNGSAGVNTSTDNSGTFYGGIVNSPLTLDLTKNNKKECFNVDVTNTYKNQLTYNFTLTNNNFVLVDINENSINDFTISAPSENNNDNTQQIELCLMINEGSQFASETEKTQVVINPTGLGSFSVGTITINVDKDENLTYEGRPEVENVTFETTKYDQDNSSLITKVSWSRKDTDGLSIANWYINLYSDNSTEPITTFTIDGSENISNYELIIPNSILTSTKFTDALNNNNNFYIKVYGKDTAGNSGETYCNDTNDYCVASNSTSLKYKFTLTYTGNASLTNTSNNEATIYLNNPFTTVITSTNSNYTLNGITIKKGTGDTPETLENGTHYNYALQSNSSTTADLTIFENIINDDITIEVATYYSGWECLIKGTKIKVYNGYKNIEDIKYDDLLVVYSYELGKEVYEYPIKIEEEGKTDHYQKITFSDGSILKTFGAHGIFSKDANKFVSVLDRNNFNIGTTVLKIENKKLKEVKVVKLEKIKEETTYYNITSTRYLNIIANDFITTDPILPISNIFSFNKNITWGKDRELYLKTKDFIPYELLKKYFPKYLYEGIRMGEAKYLINQGKINVAEYISKFNKMNFVPIPTDKSGNNKWMITTSIDLENNSKGKYYTEGSTYKLPKAKKYTNKKFIGWYNTADNKYYQEEKKIKVKYGMYFEAIYKNK